MNRRHPAWPRLRALILLLAVLACACGASPPPRALVMRDVSFPLRDMRFPSGLRVIVEEDHRSPVVGVFTLVGAGSTSDPPGKEGLAHYLEHLAFRARPDGKTSTLALLGRAGAGTWNASTGLDHTAYFELGGVTPVALAASFARCNLAPVLSIVGDEPTVRAAITAAWPEP